MPLGEPKCIAIEEKTKLKIRNVKNQIKTAYNYKK